MRCTLPAIAALLIAGPALADGTITSGGASFAWDFGQPNEVTQAAFNVGGVNHMTASDWMMTFVPFGPAGQLPGMQVLNETYTGDSAVFQIDVNGVSGTISSQILELNANEASLVQTVKLTNNTFSMMAGTVFHFADFAVNGTSNDDFATLMDPDNIMIVDGSGASAHLSTSGANAYESTLSGIGLGAGLKSGAVLSLSNSMPILQGDVANAFEWSPIILAPGQTAQITMAYNVTASSVPGPGALALLGLAGLAGTRRRR